MRQGRLGLPDIQACSHAEQRKQWGALTSPLLVGRGGAGGAVQGVVRKPRCTPKMLSPHTMVR